MSKTEIALNFTFKQRGSQVVRANLIYSKNGNGRYEEWFRVPAVLASDDTVTAELPQGTTHYFINLIDENNFLVSYPDVPGGNHFSRTGKNVPSTPSRKRKSKNVTNPATS